MTASCGLSEQLLHAWLDGEAGSHTAAVQTHVDGCRTCSARLASLRQGQRLLAAIVDRGVGEVEPLLALQGIRRHMRAHEERGFWAELRERLGDLWMFNRRALVGASVAVALGALCAPLALLLMARLAGPRAAQAVVVESLQVQDNVRAHVVPQGDNSTTLIWVEPAPVAAPQPGLAPGSGHGPTPPPPPAQD